MKQITPYDAILYPVLHLRVNGANAVDIVEHTESFTFSEHLRKMDEAKFEILDVDRTFIEDPRLEPDSPWDIQWGYPTDMSSIRPMTVKVYEPKFTEKGEVRIEVTLHARHASKLKLTSKPGNYGSVQSSDVAMKIAKKHGLRSSIQSSNDADRPIIQPPELDDYEFLHMLADRIDYEFFIEGDKLFFRSCDTARSFAPRLEFVYSSAYPSPQRPRRARKTRT
jgi:hypothetical protein